MPPPGRSEVSFESGRDTCAAWLWRDGEVRCSPERRSGCAPPPGGLSQPCVVMAHGFSGVREQRLDAYAERFAAAGLAVLLFDYRHFGASSGDPRQLVDIRRQLADWRAAIDFARSLDDIDPERIALWGSSFSGGHVVHVAASDDRVAAVVSQAPFTDGLSTIRAGGAPAALRLTAAAIRDGLGALGGHAPFYIPAVGPPGSTAVMATPEAQPGFRAIDPPGSRWENRVAARVGLFVGAYRPYSKLSKLRCPVLVVVAEQDTTTPAAPAVRAAQRSPNTELIRYPIGHFAIYVEPQFDRTVADQTEFLVRNLVGQPAAAAPALALA